MGTFRDDVVRGTRKLAEAIVDRTGLEVVPAGNGKLVESVRSENRWMARTLELMNFKAYNQPQARAGQIMPRDLPLRHRILTAAESQLAWAQDPNAGLYVDLYISFVFGDDVPWPRAHDPEVQDHLDETWEDPSNQLVLTSYEALREKGVDFMIQSNVYFLYFDDGDDGICRLSMAPFETVEEAVRHPLNTFRILYYKAIIRPLTWDWGQGAYVTPPGQSTRTVYYESARAFLDDAAMLEQDRVAGDAMQQTTPPDGSLAPGKLDHLCFNKTSDMAFGVPSMQRMIQLWSAHSKVLANHTKRMEAIAKLIMTATAKGSQADLDRIASAAMGAPGRGPFESASEFDPEFRHPSQGITPGVLAQNESLRYEALKLDGGTADVSGAITQLRASSSGAFPTTYFGEPSGSLAGDQSLELPTLKFVQGHQGLWTGAIKRFGKRSVDAAVRTGKISEWRDPTPSEIEAIEAAQEAGDVAPFEMSPDGAQVKRDLGFDLALPDPLKRAMGDLVTSAVAVASAVDPQGSNPEISRWLFGFCLQALGEADPQRIVDQVLPKHVAAAAAQTGAVEIDPKTGQARPVAPEGTDTVTGQDGDQHPASNPGGAPQQAPNAEDRKVKEARAGAHAAAARARDIDDSFGVLATDVEDLVAVLDGVPA